MAVKIKEIGHFIVFLVFKFFDKTFKFIDFRYQLLLFGSEHTVEIFATETSSIVAKDDAIRVDHRYHFKNNMFSDFSSLFWKDKLQKSFNDYTTIRFSRMYSAYGDKTSLFFVAYSRVSDSQQRNIDSWERSTKFLLWYYRLYMKTFLPKQL